MDQIYVFTIAIRKLPAHSGDILQLMIGRSIQVNRNLVSLDIYILGPRLIVVLLDEQRAAWAFWN